MKLKIKDYKIEKTKKYLKVNNLFFFINGLNRSALDWLSAEQELKTIGFSYYKVLNKTTVKTLNTSIYKKVYPAIKGSTILLKPQKSQPFLKQTVLSTFNLLFFELLIFKFNNKIYSVNSLKNTYSLSYKEAKLLLYQFNLTSVKICYKFSK
jgi:hypothetical protein